MYWNRNEILILISRVAVVVGWLYSSPETESQDLPTKRGYKLGPDAEFGDYLDNTSSIITTSLYSSHWCIFVVLQSALAGKIKTSAKCK